MEDSQTSISIEEEVNKEAIQRFYGLQRYTSKVDFLVKTEILSQLNSLWKDGYFKDKEFPDRVKLYTDIRNDLIDILSSSSSINEEIFSIKSLDDIGKFHVHHTSYEIFIKYSVILKLIGVNLENESLSYQSLVKKYIDNSDSYISSIKPLSVVLLDSENFGRKSALMDYVKTLKKQSISSEDHIVLAQDLETGIRDLFYENEVKEGYHVIEDVTLKLYNVFKEKSISTSNIDWLRVFYLLDTKTYE
ncbi:hypothetical protein COF68_04515 [Bacillus toyonensis]|uniref:hypothetical protein n=1 Tax=Bacillus toyonensis TaxID=155322 RepID=UPI000BFDF9B9|nr:hypothetical protein [Bacillus toyonensis]PHE64118.1 hypothetical protein COF68_04515 [Bacillus toyonensis]